MELSEEGLAEFFSTTFPLLNERQRRLTAAAMVGALGRGGQARVAEAAGVSRRVRQLDVDGDQLRTEMASLGIRDGDVVTKRPRLSEEATDSDCRPRVS